MDSEKFNFFPLLCLLWMYTEYAYTLFFTRSGANLAPLHIYSGRHTMLVTKLAAIVGGEPLRLVCLSLPQGGALCGLDNFLFRTNTALQPGNLALWTCASLQKTRKSI